MPYLPHAERGNPDGLCWYTSSKPTARKVECPAGTGGVEKRRSAVERHGESITRRIGPGNRRYPRRKAADATLVALPETQVKVTNQGVS